MARPKSVEMVHLNLRADQRAELRRLSEDYGWTQSELLRYALDLFLERVNNAIPTKSDDRPWQS